MDGNQSFDLADARTVLDQAGYSMFIFRMCPELYGLLTLQCHRPHDVVQAVLQIFYLAVPNEG